MVEAALSTKRKVERLIRSVYYRRPSHLRGRAYAYASRPCPVGFVLEPFFPEETAFTLR